MSSRLLFRRAAMVLLLAPFTPFDALLVVPLGAQDSLRLSALHARAAARDPRARELDLMASQSKLRLDNLAAERRPSFSLEGQTQYQSDVTHFPGTLPGGLSLPSPAHGTYDTRLVVQQRLYDPSLAPRRAVEQAQHAELESRLRVALYGVRQQVNEQFFSALRVQAQRAELEHGIADLESQLTVVNARVREGSALASEALTIRAELVRRRQGVEELDARRRAALVVLGTLTGAMLDSGSVFGTPDFAAAVRSARAGLGTVRARAEYDQYARMRDLLSKQEAARSAQDMPRVSAFGRAGAGRPGLNPLNDAFAQYWLVGVQLQWTPWNWGGAQRDREVLTLQRQVVAADEQYFTESLARGVADDLAAIDRLTATAASDDEIVSLREQIAAEMRSRFREGVVTSAEYVDRETDVLSARTARALHRVELAQAQAHFLTMLGIEDRQ